MKFSSYFTIALSVTFVHNSYSADLSLAEWTEKWNAKPAQNSVTRPLGKAKILPESNPLNFEKSSDVISYKHEFSFLHDEESSELKRELDELGCLDEWVPLKSKVAETIGQDNNDMLEGMNEVLEPIPDGSVGSYGELLSAPTISPPHSAFPNHAILEETDGNQTDEGNTSSSGSEPVDDKRDNVGEGEAVSIGEYLDVTVKLSSLVVGAILIAARVLKRRVIAWYRRMVSAWARLFKLPTAEVDMGSDFKFDDIYPHNDTSGDSVSGEIGALSPMHKSRRSRGTAGAGDVGGGGSRSFNWIPFVRDNEKEEGAMAMAGTGTAAGTGAGLSMDSADELDQTTMNLTGPNLQTMESLHSLRTIAATISGATVWKKHRSPSSATAEPDTVPISSSMPRPRSLSLSRPVATSLLSSPRSPPWRKNSHNMKLSPSQDHFPPSGASGHWSEASAAPEQPLRGRSSSLSQEGTGTGTGTGAQFYLPPRERVESSMDIFELSSCATNIPDDDEGSDVGSDDSEEHKTSGTTTVGSTPGGSGYAAGGTAGLGHGNDASTPPSSAYWRRGADGGFGNGLASRWDATSVSDISDTRDELPTSKSKDKGKSMLRSMGKGVANRLGMRSHPKVPDSHNSDSAPSSDSVASTPVKVMPLTFASVQSNMSELESNGSQMGSDWRRLRLPPEEPRPDGRGGRAALEDLASPSEYSVSTKPSLLRVLSRGISKGVRAMQHNKDAVHNMK